MRKNWKMKKAKIVALGIAHNALVVLAHALNIALWLFIMYECLIGGWGD